METEKIVELKKVTLSHKDGLLLSDVCLTLDKGEFAYLIGKSGAGKTSLLRALYNDYPIDDGEARVCGFDLMNIRRREIPMLRRKIGIVFQNFRLLNDRNVYDNLYFVLHATGWKSKNEIHERIMQTLEKVKLQDKAECPTLSLSAGEQQRVGVARAIINGPDLLLADEPTGNLDPITSSEIIELLQSINKEQGMSMIISTHDFMMIDKYEARVVACENGKLVY